MSAEERAIVDREPVENRRPTRRMAEKLDADRRIRRAIEERALDAWRRDVGARATAERDRKAAEAAAAAERDRAARREAMDDLAREAEDAHFAAVARSAAERAAGGGLGFGRSESRNELMPTYEYMPPPAIDPTDAAAQESRARELEAAAEREPSEANKARARIAAAEAVKARAWAAFTAEQKAATIAAAEAERDAGRDPVARARARAAVASSRAVRLGEAEAAAEAASLALDRAVVDVAKLSATIAHRIESRKAAVQADAARAAGDPASIGNPYWQAPVSLARWQFEALPPAAQKRAAADGVRVYDDPPPAFTASDAASALRSRGSTDRAVLTRGEFDALPAADQARAVQTAIIID